MAFRGLFIGIDRYAAAEINWLSCASRDGTALHALFTDTFGDQTALLTDEQATVAAIQQHIGQLDTVSPDDIVVIAFSGHGTETHELVGYDTDPDDLVGTAISLAALGPVQRNCDVLRLVSRRGCRSYSRLRHELALEHDIDVRQRRARKKR